jgi:uncharacterized membrane protein YgaE (UPF0421/DUF939 family)
MWKKIVIFLIGFSFIPGSLLLGAIMAELFDNHPILWWSVVIFFLSCFIGWIAVKGYTHE